MAAITITTNGLNMIRDAMQGANSSLIKYVALGSSNVAPTASDSQLGAETFRKAVTSYSNGVNPGEILINMYLAPGDAIGDDIEEVGFFGGATASSLANSGVLLAHGLYSHNPKANTESIQFQLDFTV